VAKESSARRAATLGPMTTTLHWANADLEVHKVVVGPYENNVFVLRDKQSGEAVLLDAANEHELLLEVSKATGVRRVLTTHGHFDHIQAVTQMRDAGIDVGIATEDAKMLPAYDFTIPDDDVIEVGGLRLKTIHTPGHTRGSTCFLLEGHPVLFSGDTLFPGGVGNTTFEGGDFDTIIQSVDRRLFTLPQETLVLPGHGLDTTIGTERPHLDEWIERGW
jgi:glyoxylase-like metal-dependent hydrolase (beta-lactamase superfamily II)